METPTLVTRRCDCGHEDTVTWWPEWGSPHDEPYQCYACRMEEEETT